jgi:hypothetical protein
MDDVDRRKTLTGNALLLLRLDRAANSSADHSAWRHQPESCRNCPFVHTQVTLALGRTVGQQEKNDEAGKHRL